ncbi:MAG TPA: hypothetical protein VH370_25930 [Humisphaera sp.]|jgi:hypothetical protein|nr:hypothetical protein [Humisphaera sp.]
MTQYSAQQVPDKKPATIGWLGLLPAVIFIVVEFVYGWPEAKVQSRSLAYAEGYLAGRLLAGFLISGLVALLAYGIGRRSQVAGTIAFSIVMTWFIVTVTWSGLQTPPAARQVEHDVMQSIEGKQVAAANAARELDRLSGNHLDGIDRPGEIEARLKALTTAEATNQEVLDAGDAAPADLAKGLDQAGVRQSTRDRLVREFNTKVHWSRTRQIYDVKKRGFASLRSFYRLLQDHPGKWRYNSEAKRIDFSDDALLEQFKTIQRELLTALRQQEQLAPQQR